MLENISVLKTGINASHCILSACRSNHTFLTSGTVALVCDYLLNSQEPPH